MKRALEEAQKAYGRDEVPVGAVVVSRKTGEVIAAAGNETEARHDPTAHAEILAIRQACEILGQTRLPEYNLYVTLEPCAMCAQAISLARIHSLYYGADDPKSGGVMYGARVFSSQSCHHVPEIYNGIEAAESARLLQEFFQEKR